MARAKELEVESEEDKEKPLFKRTGFDDVDTELALNTAHGVSIDDSEDGYPPDFPKGSTYSVSGVKALSAQTRIAWFRLNCPDWTTKSEIHSISDTHVIIISSISDPNGRLRATGIKRWPLLDKKRNSDFAFENAETSSLARAASNLGYDTRKALTGKFRNWHPDKAVESYMIEKETKLSDRGQELKDLLTKGSN